MRYLTLDECAELGLAPHAVYGGNVHSYRVIGTTMDGQPDPRVIPHGTQGYGKAVAECDARKSAALSTNGGETESPLPSGKEE